MKGKEKKAVDKNTQPETAAAAAVAERARKEAAALAERARKEAAETPARKRARLLSLAKERAITSLKESKRAARMSLLQDFKTWELYDKNCICWEILENIRDAEITPDFIKGFR